MSLKLYIVGFLLLVLSSRCSSLKSEKISKACNLEQVELKLGMNLDDVTETIDCCPIWHISDCKNQYENKDWKLNVIFIDKKGRLDTFFDKELNLVGYKYFYD